MEDLHHTECNCNNFTNASTLVDMCQRQCKQKADKDECCTTKCAFLDHLQLSEGKANKTAVSSLFGQAGDPKIVENFDECQSIGKIINIQ